MAPIGCGDGGGPGASSTSGTGGGGGYSVTLLWDAPTQKLDGTVLANLTGYKVYYGSGSYNYTTTLNAGNVTSYTVTGLSTGKYYFNVTAITADGKESLFTRELIKTLSSGTTPIISVTPPEDITPSE